MTPLAAFVPSFADTLVPPSRLPSRRRRRRCTARSTPSSGWRRRSRASAPRGAAREPGRAGRDRGDGWVGSRPHHPRLIADESRNLAGRTKRRSAVIFSEERIPIQSNRSLARYKSAIRNARDSSRSNVILNESSNQISLSLDTNPRCGAFQQDARNPSLSPSPVAACSQFGHSQSFHRAAGSDRPPPGSAVGPAGSRAEPRRGAAAGSNGVDGLAPRGAAPDATPSICFCDDHVRGLCTFPSSILQGARRDK